MSGPNIVQIGDRMKVILNDLKNNGGKDLVIAGIWGSLIQGDHDRVARLFSSPSMKGPHSPYRKYQRANRDRLIIEFCVEFCNAWTESAASEYLADELERYFNNGWRHNSDLTKLDSINKKLCALHQILRASPKPIGKNQIYKILVDSSFYLPPHQNKHKPCFVSKN